jgi:hypothetical protein
LRLLNPVSVVVITYSAEGARFTSTASPLASETAILFVFTSVAEAVTVAPGRRLPSVACTTTTIVPDVTT